MGGLGPTQDDLTREAVAAALGIELKRDHSIVAEMYKRFAERRIQMPENNAQQADVLQGAVVLPNSKGTAPGQWLETEFDSKPRIVVLIPGPPHELQTMWDMECTARLRTKVPAAAIASRVLKVAMMGESAVDLRTAPIYKKYPQVETTVLAGQGQVEFHLRATATTQEEAQARVDRLAGEFAGGNRQLLSADAQCQAGGGGVLHGRHDCRTPDVGSGQLAMVPRGSRSLLE
jgi:nicotinamide-nucleotide amidase